jgi:hypothetical protein
LDEDLSVVEEELFGDLELYEDDYEYDDDDYDFDFDDDYDDDFEIEEHPNDGAELED